MKSASSGRNRRADSNEYWYGCEIIIFDYGKRFLSWLKARVCPWSSARSSLIRHPVLSGFFFHDIQCIFSSFRIIVEFIIWFYVVVLLNLFWLNNKNGFSNLICRTLFLQILVMNYLNLNNLFIIHFKCYE